MGSSGETAFRAFRDWWRGEPKTRRRTNAGLAGAPGGERAALEEEGDRARPTREPLSPKLCAARERRLQVVELVVATGEYPLGPGRVVHRVYRHHDFGAIAGRRDVDDSEM